MIDLTGLHVVVTGGSRGIGAASCRAFAKAGATVLVHYRERHEEAERVLDELYAISSREHRRFPCDVTEPSEIQELFQFVGSEWGKLDCLVNNAGVWWHNPLSAFDEVRYIETMRINVRGPFLSVRAALPYLRMSKQASIINVTSTAAQRGEAFYSPYAASKGALVSATKAWASELAPEIRVNSVAPGWVDTEMSARALREDPAVREEIEAQIPLRRVATAEDIAAPIVFLASPLARHITGEILNVNGGSVLCG
ncbi:MAG: SDR family oxidoreductase [Thermoanaerobaculia bacterium]|nr:SDR family oxidoreductase [Thermoanaerobaculia bacterium]